jgi:hypothetical protein
VLEPEIVAELESLLERERATVPASPHRLNGGNVTATPTETGGR